MAISLFSLQLSFIVFVVIFNAFIMLFMSYIKEYCIIENLGLVFRSPIKLTMLTEIN